MGEVRCVVVKFPVSRETKSSAETASLDFVSRLTGIVKQVLTSLSFSK